VSQCALALERSQLYDEEQRLRELSERLQRTTASLSNAVTQLDVAHVVIEATMEGVEATGAVVFGVVEDRQVVRRLASYGGADTEDLSPEVPLDEDSPVARVARRGGWWFEPPDESASGGERTRLVVPLVSGRQSIGVLELEWEEPVTLDDDDHVFLRTIASQGAQALDRARHFETERSIAETLQRSVLPAALPRMDGVQLAARYLPGMQDVDVGGDWFDAVELPDGRLGLVVGDVVGKGVHAAASMGQLRNALRAFSVERLKPQSALAKLDLLASDSLETTFATVVYAIVDTEAGLLRFSSAGHPPPAIAYPDGRVELLDEGRGLPLGTGLGPKYRQSVVELPAGSIVMLYSDGLVERRGRSIDEGLDALVAAMRDAPKNAEGMLEHVLDAMAGTDRADDIAILAARFLPVAPRPLDLTVASTEDSLHLVRDALRTWLEGTALSRADAEDLVLAAWEICANAIEHAADPTKDTVRVRASVDETRVRVVVDDTGRFVATSSPRPDRGLGLRLAEQLASTVEIDAGEQGTSVALEKDLPEGDAAVRTARPEAE
jgi:anti-sigma regulatory factor (Ser/Thr protein kinase)